MGLCQGLDDEREARHIRMRNLAISKPVHLPQLRRLDWWYRQAESWGEAGQETRYGGADVLSGLTLDFGAVDVGFSWLSSLYYKETPFANGTV